MAPAEIARKGSRRSYCLQATAIVYIINQLYVNSKCDDLQRHVKTHAHTGKRRKKLADKGRLTEKLDWVALRRRNCHCRTDTDGRGLTTLSTPLAVAC